MLHLLPSRKSRSIVGSLVILLIVSAFSTSLRAQLAPTTTTSISNFNTHVVENMGTWAGTTTATGVTSWDMRGTGTRGSLFNGTDLAAGTAGGWYGNGNIAFLGSGTATNGNATLRLQNVTGSTINAFRIVYTGQMWKSASGSPTVSVTWSSGTSSVVPTSGALTSSLSSLSFSDATASISSGVTFGQSVTGATIANNDYVYLRWIHTGGSSSDILSWDDVNFIPRPITQVSSIAFSSVGTTSMTVSWTAGNGRRRAVFMKATTAGTITNPSDGTQYTASSTFGSGTQLGTSGYYCVYNGTGTSVNVTGLTGGTTYYVQAFEYNSDATPTAITTTYLTTTVTANQTTATPCVVPTVYTVTGTGSYCAGGSGIEIRLNNSQTGINYQVYNGSTTVGSAIAGTGASPLSLGTFTAAGTYTVLATNTTGGCTSNMSGSATISINALPTVNVSPASVPSCTTVTASGAASYVWSPVTALSASTGASVIASPTISTTYTVTGTDANGCINTATVSVVPAAVAVSGISPAAGSAPQGTANHLLQSYSLGVTGSAATVSGLSVTTFGTYTSTDVDNLKCWYSTSDTFDAATAVLLSTLNSPGAAGNKVFPAFIAQSVSSGTTGYLHITAEIGGSATGGNTLGIAATNFSGFTICAATLTGTNPVAAANTQTITASPCSGTPAAGTVTPSGTFFCGTGSVSLGLVGGATGTGLSYQWSSSATNTPPGTVIPGATDENYTASSVSSTTYYWCTTTCGASSATSAVAVVSVNAVPSLGSATTSGVVCAGGTLSLFANSPANVASYSWAGPLSFTAALQNPTIPTVTTGATGIYTVTVSNGVGAGCSQTYTTTATVNNAPISTGITTSGALCAGGTVTLNANSANATAWSWSGPDGFTSTLTNAIATPTTTGTYSLTLSNGGGSGCTLAIPYTASVVVFPVPMSTGATNSGPVCAGATVVLSANATGATSWNWSGPSGFTSTLENPSFSIAGSGVYSLTVSRTGNGCNPATVYTTSVTVNALPVISATPSTGLAGSTFSASGADTYTWLPASGLSATTGSTVTATPSSATVYTVSGISAAGCTSTATINVLPASGNLVWNFTALTPPAASSSNPAVVTAASCTATIGNSFGTVSSVINATSPSSGYAGATGGGNIGNAVALGSFSTSSAYVNYLLTPNTGYCLTVTNLSFGTRSTGTGPQGYTVTSDVTGFGSTVLASGTIPNTSTWTLASPTFTAVTGAPNTAVNVRIYGHSGSGSPSSGTVTWRMDDVTFTYSVSPSPSLTGASNNAPVCSGSTLNLFANAPQNVASYSWTGPNLFTSTAQNPTIPSVTMAAQGTYTVIVNNGNGCTQTYTTVVSLNATPSSTGPTNSSPICAGGDGSLTANSANANQWNWTGPGGFTSTLQNPLLPAAAAGTYSLTLSNTVTGCSSSSVFTTTVTVNPVPVSSGVTSDNSLICVGGNTRVRANSTDANQWSWTGAGGFTSSDENPLVSPTVTTTYSLTLSNTLTGCSATTIYTTTVSVNPAPTAAPDNSGPICVGSSVSFNSNSTHATVWTWSGPDGFTSTLANPTATPTVTGVYSLIVTDGSSQPGCSPSTIYTTSVTVNTTPTAAPTNSGPICVGGTATLSANPAGGATTYAWSGPSGYTSTVANPVVSPTTTGTYSLTVTNGTTDAGCSPTTVYTTTVTVRPTPTAAPTNNGYICNGGTVNLTANGAGGASVYNWSGLALSSSTIANPTATPTVSGVYSLTVSDGTADAGCSPATVYTTAVTVNTKPTAAPSNSGPICVGGTVNLMANGAGGATAYNWSGVSLSSSTLANPTATPTVTGVYSLTVSDGSSQPGCSPATIYTTSVTVNTTPTAAPTNSGPICVGGTATLSTNPSGGATTYAWSGPSGYTSTVANPVVSPTTTGTYSLTVTNGTTDAGCSPTTVYTTTVTVRPTPTAAPTNNGYICNGGTVSLTANGAGGVSVYNWSGLALSSSTIANPTATPTVTTVYSLTVSDGTADAGCSPATVYTTAVTVNAKPTAAPSNSGPICVGGTVNLTANGASGATVYNWSGVSLASSTLANPTATPTVTGVYSLTVSDGSSQPGCSPATIYTTSVTVNATPIAAPTNNGPICVGGTAMLSANPAGGATTYAWSGPAGYTSTEANPVVSPTTTGTYSLTVTNGTTDAGCSPTTVYTTTVTVRPTPIAAPTNNGYICNGGTVSLTANGAGGASVYNWSGLALSSSTIANPTATPTVTTVYSLTVSDGTADAGCSPATVYTIAVTVNAKPTAAPSNSGPICVGGTVNLTANGAGGATVYNWSGVSLSSSTLANPTATPTVTGVYSLTVSDGSSQPGCSPVTVYTTSVVINTSPTAAPTNSGPICVGGTATLSANPAGGAITYAWSGPLGYTSTVANPVVSPTTTGTYSLTVTNGTTDAGCSPTTVYTTTVTVRPTPTAAPTNNGYICNGGTVNLTANGAGGASVYNWSGLALSSSTIANPTATPTVSGVYSLTVSDGTADAGCSPATVYTTAVTVNTKPTAAPSNSGPICVGGTVNLMANGAGGATVYNWSGVSLSSSTLANPTATPTVTGVYSLTVSDGSSQPGCSPATVYTTSVTVNTTPTAAPTNNGPVCVGGTAMLSANPAGGATTYAWSGPSGYISTVANPVVSPTTTGTYSLTVTNGTTDAGCSPNTVYTTTVTVRPTPTAAPTNNGYICNGGTVSLTANGAGGASVYNWSGIALSSSTIANPTATPTVTTVYSLTVSDGTADAGCSPATVYTTAVTVNAKPTAAPSNSGPICVGGTVNLTANGAGGATVYNWSGVSLSSSTLANPTATPTVTGVYSLTVSDGSSQPGCSPATVYTTSVTVNPLPIAGSIIGIASVCVGSTTSLGNTIAGGSWTSANEAIAIVGTSGIVSGVAAGTTTISYSVTNSCGTATATHVVTVNPLPFSGIISGDTTVCAGASIALSTTSTGGAWTSSNTAVASVGATGIVTGNAAGSVLISYTVVNACGTATTTRAITVNIIPSAGTIAGVGTVCAGDTITLSNAAPGGVWSSSSPLVASVNAMGVVSGWVAGTSTISYTVSSVCGAATVTRVITVNLIPVAAAITGTMSPICPGTTTIFANTTSGGTWSSSTPSVAVVNAAGIVTGISAGTATISYAVSNICGAFAVAKEVTVNPAPPVVSISGPISVTLGTTIDLVGSPSGGTWSSLFPAMATVNTDGVVTGMSSTVGTTIVTYTASNYCGTRTATKLILVNAITGTDILGSYSVCVGKTTNLSNLVAGGTWTSSNTSVATVSSSGVVTGLVAGTTTILYIKSTSISAAVITVNPLPDVISGPTTVCAGSVATLTSSEGGLWSSSNPAAATVNATGQVTGMAAATTRITYQTISGCITTKVMSVHPLPADPAGISSVCAGNTVTFTNSSVGTWSSANMDIATVPSTPGIVSGVAAGTAIISFRAAATGCYSSKSITVNALPSAIVGADNICVGNTAIYTSATTGGTWAKISMPTAALSINTSSGEAAAYASGTATITYYSAEGCVATKQVTVSALPGTLSSSTTTLCTGSDITITAATPGGTWASSNETVATVAGGVVSGIGAGTATISYTNAAGCSRQFSVTVNTPPTVAASGTICVGSTATLSTTISGTWSVSNTSVATISAAGVVTGIGAGTTVITYRTNAACYSTGVFTVTPAPDAIAGATMVCTGAEISLSHAIPGGTWSSSAPSRGSIATDGVVRGLSTGTVTITYSTVSGCLVTKIITVNPLPNPIGGAATLCAGSVTTLSNSTPGGTWQSEGVVTTVSSGNVTGVSAGTSAISYIVSATGCMVTRIVSVYPVPVISSLSGGICVGETTTLNATPSGGTWVSSTPAIASVGLSNGIVTGTGTSGGNVAVSYTLPTGCQRITTVNIVPAPGIVSGSATTFCAGTFIDLTATEAGLTWSSSNLSVANVIPTGGTVCRINGVAPGTATISYVNTSGCMRTTVVTVTAAPSPVSGIDELCVGCTASVANVTTGGTWSSSNTARAIISPSSGVITGVSAGMVVVTYRTSPTCYVTKVVTVVAPSAIGIAGPNGVCIGSDIAYTHATAGGTWGISITGFASINTSTGVVTGVTQGTTTITYFITPGNYVTKNITVYPYVFPVSGTYTVCVGGATTLTSATAGGTWSINNPAIATITSSSGVLTGITDGTTTVTYTNPGTGCFSLRTVTVHPLPSPITGPSSVCVGANVTLFSSPSGGTWYTSAGIYATVVAATGVVTGVTASPVTINYMSAAGCVSSRIMTVNPQPGIIAGASSLGTVSSNTATLSCTPAGGQWTSSNSGVAVIGLASGFISGVGVGTADITYALPGTGCYRTRVQTVVAGRPDVANGGNTGSIATNMSVYPSPTTGTVYIQAAVDGELMLITSDGKLISTYKTIAGEHSIELPQGVAAGVYVCRFVGADGSVYLQKIIYQP